MTKMTVRAALARPGFLALSAGLAFCLCTRDMPQFLAIEDLNAIPATQYLLAAARAVVFLVALLVLARPGAIRDFSRTGRLAALPVVVAVPFAVVGLGLIALASDPLLRCIGCACLGFGQSCFLISWLLRMLEQPRRVMIYLLMTALVVAGGLEAALSAAQSGVEVAATLAFPVLSCVMQVWWLRRCGKAEGARADEGAAASTTWLPQGPGAERAFDMDAGMFATLFTFFCYSFVIRQLTDTWMGHVGEGDLLLFQLFGGLGTMAAAGIVYVLFNLRKSRKQTATYTAFVLPLLIAALYLSTFLTGTLSILYVLPLFMMRKMLLMLALVGSMRFRQGEPRVRFLSLAFLFVEVASVVQTAFYEAVFSLPGHGDLICNLVVFGLVAYIAVREIAAYAVEPDGAPEEAAGALDAVGVDDACADGVSADCEEQLGAGGNGPTTELLRHDAAIGLRGEFGLTAREAEVAELLAMGRNAEYIAKELFIAHSTAKSHIAHIYQKTGLNSQQRLMDLIEERMREQ